jgi:glycosyltransferase involved in cell wall biosynthesis
VGGGSDRSLFELVTHLPRDRYAPLAILREGDPMAERYRDAGIPVEQLSLLAPRRAFAVGQFVGYAMAFWPAVFRIRTILRSNHVGIVHVNTLFNLQGAVAARLAGLPLVWHVRESANDSRAGRVMLAWPPRLATRVIANSSAVGESLMACGDRLRVVPNGLDLVRYANFTDLGTLRADLDLGDGPVVSTIGRIEPWKGQHVFVEAAESVLAAFPDAIFLVVGGPAVNKPDYFEDLKAQVRKRGLVDRIHFTGPRDDIPEILAASDLLVLPSATPEPFGRTLVEAMAAARPVVATNAGGPMEIVDDGVTGRLVTPGDADAMAEAIQRVLSDPDESRRMGQRGRERAFEHFGIDRLIRDISAVFEEVR